MVLQSRAVPRQYSVGTHASQRMQVAHQASRNFQGRQDTHAGTRKLVRHARRESLLSAVVAAALAHFSPGQRAPGYDAQVENLQRLRKALAALETHAGLQQPRVRRHKRKLALQIASIRTLDAQMIGHSTGLV